MKKAGTFLKYIIIPIILFISFTRLQFSSVMRETYSGLDVQFFAMNILLLLLLFMLLLIIFQIETIALLLFSVFTTVWSIANYYVIMFHGSPLFFSELSNLRTAADVAGEYRLPVDLALAIILAMFLLELALIVFVHFVTEKKKNRKLHFCVRTLILLAACGVLFSFKGKMRENKYGWSWRAGIIHEGFLISNVRDYVRHMNKYIKPEGYSAELLKEKETSDDKPEQFPDIILILNESFCDLDYYTKINADSDYLQPFYSIDGAFYGHAVSPSVGGGTNDSEYELLTSKSMRLMGTSAPFNYLDQELLGRGVVNYLKEFGYHSVGMHTGHYNYRRNVAYPSIGFDDIYLGQEEYSYFNLNGKRKWLDQDNYQDMIDHYNALDDSPRLMFVLTFQNHGGYEQNDASFDTVHTRNDYGGLTDDVNEYMSSMKLSAEAFAWLTDYYSVVDRPVIICMVGDHAPSFISNLPAENDSGLQVSVSRRIIPYVLWSNYGLSFEGCPEYAAMTDLVPITLEKAGIPLSTFYRTILDVNRQYPIRTVDGYCVDAQGNGSQYDEKDDKYETITDYYYLEYNSLLMTDEYREDLFLPGR